MDGGCRPGGGLLGLASLASAIGASNPLNFEHKAALYWYYQSPGFALIRDKKCEWASAAALRGTRRPPLASMIARNPWVVVLLHAAPGPLACRSVKAAKCIYIQKHAPTHERAAAQPLVGEE